MKKYRNTLTKEIVTVLPIVTENLSKILEILKSKKLDGLRKIDEVESGTVSIYWKNAPGVHTIYFNRGMYLHFSDNGTLFFHLDEKMDTYEEIDINKEEKDKKLLNLQNELYEIYSEQHEGNFKGGRADEIKSEIDGLMYSYGKGDINVKTDVLQIINELQEEFDENGYGCDPEIKLQRVREHIRSTIKIYNEKLQQVREQYELLENIIHEFQQEFDPKGDKGILPQNKLEKIRDNIRSTFNLHNYLLRDNLIERNYLKQILLNQKTIMENLIIESRKSTANISSLNKRIEESKKELFDFKQIGNGE